MPPRIGHFAGLGQRPSNVVGDTDASFADWYGGHELAHTFGRHHPGFCPGNSADDPNFPNPNGQLSDNAGTYNGLDFGDPNLTFGDPATPIPMIVLPGRQRFDVMTYCNQPQWLSAYNYVGLGVRAAAENPSLGGSGVGGPVAGGSLSGNSGTAPLPPKPKLAKALRPFVALSRPAEVLLGRESPPLANKPSVDERPPLPVPAAAGPPDITPAMPGPPIFVEAEDFGPQDGAVREKPQVELKKGKFVVIVAKLNLTQSTGKILYVKHVPQAQVPTREPTNIAAIRISDRTGKAVGTYPQWVRLDTDVPAAEDQTALINATIPAPQNVGVVELVLRGRVVDQVQVAPAPPKMGSINIRSSELAAGGGVTVAWEAPREDGTTYEIQISTDDSRTWETVAIGYHGSSLEITPDLLLGRKLNAVRVIASDGYNESKPVTVRVP